MIVVLGHLVTKHCKIQLVIHVKNRVNLIVFFLDTPSTFFALHWLTWVNALTAILLLLLSRGHYSIDVIIAYWLATRMW
jgi:hypothetical protein